MTTTAKAWMIDKDLINTDIEVGTWGNQNGVCLMRGGKVKGTTHKNETVCPALDSDLSVKFRIKDDDGELYYEGRMTHALADSPDVLRPLDDFATPNAGATTLEIWSNVKNDWDIV